MEKLLSKWLSIENPMSSRNSPMQFDLIYIWLTKYKLWLKEGILANKARLEIISRKKNIIDLPLLQIKKD